MKKNEEKHGISAAEAYRLVRTTLLAGERDERQTIAVTSAHWGEGKSTVAANLGKTCANADRHVLLIDANFHNPSLHARFGLENKNGLIQALDGNEVEVQAVSERLDLLAAGHATDNASDQLVSDKLVPLIQFLKSQYDLIIVDTPPVLKTSDAVAIAACVESILMVVRSSATRKAEFSEALKQLKRTSSHIAGVVLNRIPSVKRDQQDQKRSAPFPVKADAPAPAPIRLAPAILHRGS